MEHHNTETRRLATWVHLPGPNGEYVGFGPDDHPLPNWAVQQLQDNPRVWRADDTELEDPPPPAQSLLGGVYEPGSMISTPEVTTTGQLPPSSTPMAQPSRGSGRPQAPAAVAEPGLAEARRRYAAPPGDAA